MRVAVPRETLEGERRVALVPESCKKLTKAGIQVVLERSAGEASYFSDEAYREAGATIEADRRALLGAADLLLTVQPPTLEEIDALKPGAMLLTTLTPTRSLDVVK